MLKGLSLLVKCLKDRRNLASQYEVGANLSGIVMISPEDKKSYCIKKNLPETLKEPLQMMK